MAIENNVLEPLPISQTMGLSVLGESRQPMSQHPEREIEILWLYGHLACSASSMPSSMLFHVR